MKENISFLIGAGFSIPAGFPSAEMLGKSIIKYGIEKAIDRNKASSGSSLLEYYILGAIKFYIKTKTNSQDCNYEDFLDFLYKTNSNNKFIDFLKHYFPLKRIDIEINQELIDNNYLNAGDMYLDWTRNCMSWPKNIEINLPKYQNFTKAISSIPNEITINFHTTNHDLLLEYLSDKNMFGKTYNDGFSNKSNYYYLNRKNRKIICPIYTNNYSGNLRLYKIHGSLNYYHFHEEKGSGIYITKDFIKTGFDFDEFNLYEARKDDKPVHDPLNYIPVFLTGRETKAKQYQNKTFFEPCLKRFAENLSNCKILVVIGFSFNDIELVKIIKTNLPQNVHCRIIDPYPSESIKRFAKSRKNVRIIEKGIEAIIEEDLMTSLIN